MTPFPATLAHARNQPEEGRVLDIVFIVLGVGGILLMVAYAEFCARI